MATRRNLTDQDIAELVYLTLMHIRWKMQTFLLRVTVTVCKDTDGFTDTYFTQWTGSKNCRPAVPVFHGFTGGPSGLCQRATAHQDRPFRT